jgi:hypothetical protein
MYPLSMYNLNIILAKGRSDLHFRLEIYKKLGSAIFLLLIIPFGLYGAVYAAAISLLIHAFFNSFYSGRLINYPFIEQVKNVFPIFLIGCASMIGTYVINFVLANIINLGDLSHIVSALVIFLILYLLLSFICKISCIDDIKAIFNQLMEKLKKNRKIMCKN